MTTSESHGAISGSRVSDEHLAEMLEGLEGVTPGPWFYDVPDPGYTYDYVKTSHPDFAPTEKDRFRNQIAETDGATLLTQKIGQHIARCDPDTMRSILSELQSLRSEPSEPVAWSHELAMEMAAKDPWTYADQIRIRGLLTQIQALLASPQPGASS